MWFYIVDAVVLLACCVGCYKCCCARRAPTVVYIQSAAAPGDIGLQPAVPYQPLPSHAHVAAAHA